MKKWRVLLLDTKKSNPNHYICLAIKEAFEHHPCTESVTKAHYGNAIRRARDNQCNLFVAFDGEQLDQGICARIAAICGISVLWVTEDPYEVSVNQTNAQFFDLVFTNDSASAGHYGSKGRHLPFAASPLIHFKEIVERDEDYRYDVFFAGTAWPNRVEFIKQLQTSLGEINLKLALPYNEHLPAPDIGLAPSTYLWKTPNSEFARLASKSRIVLTLHRSFSSSGNATTANTPGPRLFEVALAGGFQLVDMSLPETAHYFTEGSEFVGFRTSEECIEKIAYYLSHQAERIAIAKEAQVRAERDHLYIHRIDKIFKAVSLLPVKLEILQEAPRRPRVLFVTHNVIEVQPYGGVEVYQHLIMGALKFDFDIFVYTIDRSVSPHGKKYNLYGEGLSLLESHTFDRDISTVDLTCPDRERRFSEIVTRLGIDLVHFQHFIGHVPSLPYITKALGIPSIASLHDYYAVCTHFNLIGYHGRFCNISKLPAATCDVCLNAQDNAAAGSQAIRRAFFSRALAQIDVLHANTAGVARLFEDMFPGIEENNHIRIFGVPMPPDNQSTDEVVRVRPIGPINVAIIGNFTQNKGGDVFIHTFNQMRDEQIRFHIFGTVGAPYDEIMRQLALPNVEVLGGYSAGTLVERLQDMSLSLHMSIWPETFCITLSEAWKAGLVPIVADIGALGERVLHGSNGFKVPPGEPGAVVSILRELVADPSRIENIRGQLTPDLYVTNQGHMDWLDETYRDLLSRIPQPRSNTLHNPKPSVAMSLADCGVILNRKTWLIRNDGSEFQAIAQLAPQARASALHQFMRYAKNYGTKAAVRRALQQVRIVYGNRIGMR
jgi:glycosyltransferase involved in cell wall biosynthesis